MAIQFCEHLGAEHQKCQPASRGKRRVNVEVIETIRMAISCDFLVIGSGVAGLSFCLEAAAKGSVCLVTKRSIDESNTKYAQGGIAAVLAEGDSFEAHT